MFITPREVIDILVMTLGVGFIFMDIFKVPRVTKFDWHALMWACLVTGPAVILHELAHKFVAIAFGVEAVFHAAYPFLLLGIILKLVRSPIIFLIPGYVSLPALLPTIPLMLVAFAGPALNGLLYILAVYVMQTRKLSRKAFVLWFATRRINGFWFILNLLPIPGLDGFKVFAALFTGL